MRPLIPLAALALVLAGPVRADSGLIPGDCFNDGNLPDLEPPEVLRVTETDIQRVLAEIAAHEQRLRAEREAREAALAAAARRAGGG